MAYRRLVAFFAAALALMLVSGDTRTRAGSLEVVSLASDSVIALSTPPFIQVGKRYAFTWAGGGPAQSYVVKSLRKDGWVLVEVADESTNTAYLVPNELATRWLNVGIAISIQEMRPIQ
jgi:hypothetical protein